MLKHTASAIAPVLTLLFNQSLKSCIVPQDWKAAHVTLFLRFPLLKPLRIFDLSPY